MKKMMAGIAALVAALIVSVSPVKAQNNRDRFNSNSVGTPGFTLNSAGSFYGQFSNSYNSNQLVSQFNLGYGTSQSVNGTNLVSWDTNGTVIFNGLEVDNLTQNGTGESSTTGMYRSSAVVVTTSWESVISSGGIVVITATPSIATMTASGFPLQDGTKLVLFSTSATGGITFQDNGTLSNSQLELGAATRALTLYKTLTLRWSAALGKWIEIAFGNN